MCVCALSGMGGRQSGRGSYERGRHDLNTESAMPVAQTTSTAPPQWSKSLVGVPPARPASAHPPSINVFKIGLRSYPRRRHDPMTQREAPFLDLAL